jgi:threonine dehydrogenase-like Zn-dependent dehydrogenase
VLNAVRMARIELGDRVAVVGAGLIGLLAARLTGLAGGRRVTALDLIPARTQLARRFGADAALDPTDPVTPAELERIAPGGFDVVFEASGAAAAVPQALRLAARGGRVVLLGSTRGVVEGFDPYADVHVKGITVLGAHVSTAPAAPTLHDRWTEAANRALLLDLMAAGDLPVAELVTDRVRPDSAPAAFEALADRPAEHLGILIDWS